MDQKYYALVELIAFSVIAVAFLGYQIWSVRRKTPDDSERHSPDSSDSGERSITESREK